MYINVGPTVHLYTMYILVYIYIYEIEYATALEPQSHHAKCVCNWTASWYGCVDCTCDIHFCLLGARELVVSVGVSLEAHAYYYYIISISQTGHAYYHYH